MTTPAEESTAVPTSLRAIKTKTRNNARESELVSPRKQNDTGPCLTEIQRERLPQRRGAPGHQQEVPGCVCYSFPLKPLGQ